MASDKKREEAHHETRDRQYGELARLDTERQELITRGEAAKAAEVEAAKADDQGALDAARAEQAAVAAALDLNARNTTAKRLAVETTEAKIVQARRQAAMDTARDLTAAAAPIAAAAAKAMYAFTEALTALKANRDATYRALGGYGDAQAAFAQVASTNILWGDADFHLRSALGIEVPAGPPHGDCDMQQIRCAQLVAAL